jgi:hypothetical protein
VDIAAASGGWQINLVSALCSSHSFERIGADEGSGQKIVDRAVGMVVDDLGEDVGELVVGVDATQFAGFDQRRVDRPVLAAAIRACEESVLSERDRPNGTFDRVGVDLDPPVADEASQAFTARQRKADRLGEFALLADERELCAQPLSEVGED